MKQPLFSIIIANFNYGRFLDEAIQSVLSQSCQDFELIVVDGGSTDESVEVIKKYEERLAWWVSEPDKGQSEAFNKGFAHAKGRFLTWLNADDIFLPEALATIAKAIIANPSVEWIAGGMAWCNKNLQVVKISIPHILTQMRVLGKSISVGGPSSFFTKRLLLSVGGIDEVLHYSMDTDLWYKFVFVAGKRYLRVARPIWAFRMHIDSKTACAAVDLSIAESRKRLERRLEETNLRQLKYGRPNILSKLSWLSVLFWYDSFFSIIMRFKYKCQINNLSFGEKQRILLSNSIQEYMSGLRKISMEVHVFNTWYRKQFNESEGWHIVDSNLLKNAKECAKYVIANKITVLYAQGMRSLLFFHKVKRVCRDYKVTIMVNCHSPMVWDSAWRSFVFVVCGCLLSDIMIFLVEKTRRRWAWLLKLSAQKNFHVTNPVEISRFHRKTNFHKSSEIVLGCIGTISYRKRQDMIVKIVSRLRLEGYNVKARLSGNIGKGGEEYMESLKSLIRRLDMNDFIIYDGTVSYDEIPNWLQKVDIYICPSESEVMPFSILEAMSTGLPIVAHDVAGIHEEVHDGENGILVRSNSLEDYVLACKNIIDHDLFYKMGAKSYEMAEKIFSVDVYARLMRNIIYG